MIARIFGAKWPCLTNLLCVIYLNSRNSLGTPELRAAMAAMTDEQRYITLMFLECNTEKLAGLLDGCGI